MPLLLHSQKQGAIVYNVISNKVLYQIIIGVVICVLTFVIETYIFTKIDNDNLFIQWIKRSVLYFFIINITIITAMVIGLNIFE